MVCVCGGGVGWGAPSKLREYVSWHCRVYVVVRLLRRESSHLDGEVGCPPTGLEVKWGGLNTKTGGWGLS